ncbi:hypothetical protein A8924_0508 [Saccharopolyspora erythraea NRRL 2338]|uniref:Uncharacterized protein n=2 Tax=Saccharopolyspora erythraea TaxID=1836 RepID=A4F601_SACEN|nr:hypothetical protein N599_23475 [Saccharopolyspora erythraea D]PFG93274.1 hypothetical protein A8924_0508 [Saccharopolyspora erythraea NRRL 2338]CAL99475.1 hypothetical protein SACE_0122 [Saccharopolyspora erythraea NRRL 2338]
MTDPRVLELLAENSPIKADSDMLELHFTVRDDALVAA